MSLELDIRERRDDLLNQCDKWLQIEALSYKTTAAQKVVLMDYMQALRDWPKKDPLDNSITLPANKWIQPSAPSFEECGVEFK